MENEKLNKAEQEQELISEWLKTNKITYIQPNTRTRKTKMKVKNKKRNKKGFKLKGKLK
jgi:hypothetical protein